MSINKQMELYHKIEQVLREAAKTKHAMTIRDIFEVPAIREVAKNELQVRDKVRNLHEHQLLTRVTVPMDAAAGDKRNKVGYYWRHENKTADDMHSKPKQQGVVDMPGAVAGKGIEFVMSGITVVIGINEATGRLRIVIDE
jgi:hypothetical protein